MTLTLELTREEESDLRTNAARAGLDEAAYLRSLISDRRATRKTPKTPADMVAHWQANGLLTGYGDPSKESTEVAHVLREKFSHREYVD